MKFKIILFLSITLSLFVELNAQTDPKIIVYGSDECGHCRDLKQSMDSANIKYTFYDIELDKVKEAEMVEIFRKHRVGGNIHFPVVEINGRKLVLGADFRKVFAALNSPD